MVYTEPNATQTANLQNLAVYINDASGGLFGLWTLIGIFAIIFINSLIVIGEPSRAFLVSSFMVSIIAILMGIMGFLNPTFIYFFIILTAFGLMWRFLASRR